MSTNSNENKNGNGGERLYQWPSEVLELAKTAQDLNAEGLSKIVTQIVNITGYPRKACRRFVQRIIGSPSKHYVWPKELEAVVNVDAGVKDREALIQEIMTKTGYPRRACRRFLTRRLSSVKIPKYRWPNAVRGFVLAHREAGEKKLWPLVLKVMKMTGRPRHSCYLFVSGLLERKKKALKKWRPEVHAVARGNENLEGPEFEALVEKVKEMSGYDDLACRGFVRRLAEKKQYRHYKWPKEVREFARKNRVVTIAEYCAIVSRIAKMTGHPKHACRRLLKRVGIKNGYRHRRWMEEDLRKLARQLGNLATPELARQLRRSVQAVRRKYSRLGLNATLGKDWYPVTALARELHVSVVRIRQWIEQGKLLQTAVGTGEYRRLILTSEDVARFCKKYMHEIIRGEINADQVAAVERITGERITGKRRRVVRKIKQRKRLKTEDEGNEAA